MIGTAAIDQARQVRLIYTDLDANNNKFWHADRDGTTAHFHWGRVGAAGQTQTLTFPTVEETDKEIDKRRASKMRKGYTEQRTLAVSSDQITVAVNSTSIEHSKDTETTKLVDFLVARNIHKIEDTTSVRLQSGILTTPLGPVTRDGIDEAERILNQMLLRNGSVGDLANQYMRIVPRDIGTRRVDPAELFAYDKLTAEQSTLDSLRAALDALEAQASGTKPQFSTSLTLVGRDREDLFQEIRTLYKSTVNAKHTVASLSLHRVWEARIAKADAAFEGPRVGNVRRLWHGTKDANLLSILRQGYVIPRGGSNIAITGRMFGDGIYFSDQSTKSLQYATSFWGGTGSRRTFMLLNDVAMGKEYNPRSSFSGQPPKGHDSTYVRGGTAGVRNNEMIVYRESQVRPLFLVEFR